MNNDTRLTSNQWYELLNEPLIILDFDGWDRKNLHYSWDEELITREEYAQRLCKSTIAPKGWNK